MADQPKGTMDRTKGTQEAMRASATEYVGAHKGLLVERKKCWNKPRLNLPSNYFTGNIPSCLGKLDKLFYLDLDKNKFEAQDSQSGEFLSALSNCPDLQTLSLYGNQLQGVLPHSVGNLSIMLQELNLGANNLFGTVPRSIGALKNLEYLDLGGSNFVGPIPHSISNLSKLWRLNLSSNHFEGW
uniref:LRR receptor-like serine/threonine-protein kinase ERL1 n=1 Tax=Aegilops tauschii TaxID=37682 RepID=M8CN69_AEGTA